MKGFIPITLILLGAASAPALDYYVAMNGLDGNAGTNAAAPFRTIGAAAAVMTAGDTCHIRGGTYRETVAPTNSGAPGAPIVFMPYNSETVTVSAAEEVTGWTVYSNSIHVANMGWTLGEGFNQVFVNGVMVNRARWPNTGTDLLIPTLASGSTAASSVTFSVSRPVDYWVGGTVYGCFGNKWTSQSAIVSASTAAGALTVTGQTSPWYTGSGKGYITGILGELDSPGEWFLSGTNLYLWAPGSADPATLSVEAKARPWCVNLSGKSHIAVRGLRLFGAGIRMDADNCEVGGCDVKYLSHFTKFSWGGMDAGGGRSDGHNGVWVDGDYNVLSNCTFRYSAGSGIILYGASNTITRCVVTDIDYSGTYSCPLSIRGSTGGNRIHFNTMGNTGRDVVQLYRATADEIMYNDLYNAGRLCHDLGITYQWGRDGQGTRIAYNWVHDNLGGTGPGIYHDNYCRDFITDHNVIWNCEAGVRLNTPCDAMQVYNNTLFNCADVGANTYNAWPNNIPAWWTYGNIANSTRINNLFLGTNPGAQLTDYANRDFTLKSGAAAIDSGSVVSPYTDGYVGSAPDKGAYEFGVAQWSAGHLGVGIPPATDPVMRTDPATGVTAVSAALNGMLMSTGAAPTYVRLYWGDNDGFQVKTNWDNEVSMGLNTATPPVAYSTNLGGLTLNTTYYYRYCASNEFAESWGNTEWFTPTITQSAVFAVSDDLDIQPNGTKSSTATTLFAGNNTSSTGTDRRIFMKFDLSGLAEDWSIHSATLGLYHIAGVNDDYGNAVLYPVTNSWTAASVTYSHPVVTDAGSTILGAAGPFNAYRNIDVTSVILQYQADADSHHGFSIRGTEGFTETAKYFASSESANPPELVVVYTSEPADRPPVLMAEAYIQRRMITVGTVKAADPDGADILTYSISGGADMALFNIDPETGRLTMPGRAGDAGSKHLVEVTVTDSAMNADKLLIEVTVVPWEVPSALILVVQ